MNLFNLGLRLGKLQNTEEYREISEVKDKVDVTIEVLSKIGECTSETNIKYFEAEILKLENRCKLNNKEIHKRRNGGFSNPPPQF